MSDNRKNDYIKELSERTHLSEGMLGKFSPGDLKQFFQASANPELIRGTGAAFIALVASTIVGISFGQVSTAIPLLTGLLAMSVGHWHTRLRVQNETLIRNISSRATAVATSDPAP